MGNSKLENNYTTKFLLQEWKSSTPCHSSQTGGFGSENRSPQKTWFWRPVVWLQELHRMKEKETTFLDGAHKVWCTQGLLHTKTQKTKTKTKQWSHKRLGQNYLLVLEGLLQSQESAVLTVRTKTLATVVMVGTHWHEPSWRLLFPPKILSPPSS